MAQIKTKNVVFITGSFVHHSSWDEWIAYFNSKGYHAVAPPWLYKNEPVDVLRSKHPDKNKALAELTLEELLDYYAGILEKYPEKPIVIGHSFGGLITQIMVNRDLVAAGVAIHPAPPQGVFPYEFTFLKSGWKALGFLTPLDETYLMSFDDWQYAFVNGMPLEEQKATYAKYTIPESKTVTRGALTEAAKIDFEKEHAPLLITSGDKDHIIPAHLNERNFHKYARNNSITEYKEFEGRNHLVLGQKTWKEDADYIMGWLKQFEQTPEEARDELLVN